MNELRIVNEYSEDSDTFCILDDIENVDPKILEKVCSKCCHCNDHYLLF